LIFLLELGVLHWKLIETGLIIYREIFFFDLFITE
jgi:hypothetical protein